MEHFSALSAWWQFDANLSSLFIFIRNNWSVQVLKKILQKVLDNSYKCNDQSYKKEKDMLFHFKIVLYTLLITNLAENNVYHE